MTTQTTSQAQPKAYNLHTVGMGFVNRLRFVKPEGKGKGYWCVSIGALYGVEDENGRSESSLFDLNVVGKAAKESVQTLQAAFNEGKKIFVEFKAGDSRAEHFQYKKGQRAGQWGSCIKGTLLQLRKAWVNGELVIDTSQQPDQDEVSDESSDDVSSAQQAPLQNPWRLKRLPPLSSHCPGRNGSKPALNGLCFRKMIRRRWIKSGPSTPPAVINQSRQAATIVLRLR